MLKGGNLAQERVVTADDGASFQKIKFFWAVSTSGALTLYKQVDDGEPSLVIALTD